MDSPLSLKPAISCGQWDDADLGEREGLTQVEEEYHFHATSASLLDSPLYRPSVQCGCLSGKVSDFSGRPKKDP